MCGCRMSVDHDKKPAGKNGVIRATCREFWFVLPDANGAKLICLKSEDYGGEPEEEELAKMQPSGTKDEYTLLKRVIAELTQKLQEQ